MMLLSSGRHVPHFVPAISAVPISSGLTAHGDAGPACPLRELDRAAREREAAKREIRWRDRGWRRFCLRLPGKRIDVGPDQDTDARRGRRLLAPMDGHEDRASLLAFA